MAAGREAYSAADALIGGFGNGGAAVASLRAAAACGAAAGGPSRPAVLCGHAVCSPRAALCCAGAQREEAGGHGAARPGYQGQDVCQGAGQGEGAVVRLGVGIAPAREQLQAERLVVLSSHRRSAGAAPAHAFMRTSPRNCSIIAGHDEADGCDARGACTFPCALACNRTCPPWWISIMCRPR